MRIYIIAIFILFSNFKSLAFDFNIAINLAGKQRMLTQKMSKESLQVFLGEDIDGSKKDLEISKNLFDKTLKGLINGDSSLAIERIDNPRIIKQLKFVQKLWYEFQQNIDSILLNPENQKNIISEIDRTNIKLLKEMNRAVKIYETTAFNKDENPILSKLINIAGRQRMLTQKMVKEFLFVKAGINVNSNKANLAKTINLFDSTLESLINGNQESSIPKAPSKEISLKLQEVKALWEPFKLAISQTPSEESVKFILNSNMELLKQMNAAVGLYSKITRG